MTTATAHTHRSGPDQFACGVFKNHHWSMARYGITTVSVVDGETIEEIHVSPDAAALNFDNVVRIWNL